MLIFFDNCSGKSYLENETAALSINQKNKYSILSQLNDALRVKGKYEFILEWPSLKMFYQWRQTNNPVYEYEKNGVYKAEGFEPLYNGSKDSTCWGGLVRTTIKFSNNINSLLDGCPGTSYWYYSIGMYKTVYSQFYNTGYPTTYGRGSGTDLVYLWVRYPFNNFTIFIKKRTKNIIILILIFLISS